jgi:long-chain acyl-CoA synthetase
MMKDADKTIAQIFWMRASENKDKPLFLYPKEGDAVPYTENGKPRIMTWAQAADQVENIGIGLMALGAQPGDRISIMANTSPQWVMADLALLSLGGQTGSIYPNVTPAQAQYIINDLDSGIVFVEGKNRRDGLLALKDNSPQLKKVITIGCDAGDDPLCMSFEELIETGKSLKTKMSGKFHDQAAAGRLKDVASYIYTSGTTGTPKGAVHTHESVMYTICTGAAWVPVQPGWTDLSFLPMAHIFEQFAGPFLDIYRGDVLIGFARSLETVAQDFALVKPHFCRTTPRFFEKIYSVVWSKAGLLTGLSAEELKNALAVSKRVVIEGGLYGKIVSEQDRQQHQAYAQNNYKNIKALVLGGNIEFFVAGGAPLSREINEFFWCLGLPIYELYGMTETGGATTNRPGAVKLGTVGKSWPGNEWPSGGCEVTLSDIGEILIKGPNVMLRYHNKPKETEEALKDGWMHSGDIGEKDEDGFFKITDRIKDIIITAGGKNIAPVGVESIIKEDPLISQAVVYGDRKKYLTALITLDPIQLAAQAKALGLDGDYKTLSQHPAIYAQVEKIIARKNQSLARFETIKKFRILDHDLTIENGDITPTMKVKRKTIFEKYKDLFESLYTD